MKVMAMYDYKEFLTFDDVAEYLTDKGVCNFGSLNNYTYPKFRDFMLGLINEGKIQALFYYHGYVIDLIDDWFSYVDSPKFEPFEPYTYKRNTVLHKGYFVANQKMLDDWQNDNVINYIQSVCSDEFYYSSDLKGYRAYNNPKGYALTSPPPTNHINLLFSKSQLNAIFDPSDDHTEQHTRIAELEREITAKDERIAELESVGGVTSLKGFDKVNYDREIAKKFACIVAKSIWEMDKTEQIRTNDMIAYIKGLLYEFSPNDLPETDKTLSLWLNDIKPEHATKAGRTSKDAPQEIPLTFKK